MKIRLQPRCILGNKDATGEFNDLLEANQFSFCMIKSCGAGSAMATKGNVQHSSGCLWYPDMYY